MKKTATNLLKWTVLSALTVVTIVACQKKGSDAPADTSVPTCAAGVNCVNPNGPIYAGSGNLINNVKFSYSPLGLEGVISLTATSPNSYTDFNDPRVPAKYYGSFSAQGSVTLNSSVTCAGVPLTGTYSLIGSQGMYTAGILSGFIWDLSGPAAIKLMASGSSVLYSDVNGLSRDGNNRIGLSVDVYVNNQYCGYIYTQ